MGEREGESEGEGVNLLRKEMRIKIKLNKKISDLFKRE